MANFGKYLNRLPAGTAPELTRALSDVFRDLARDDQTQQQKLDSIVDVQVDFGAKGDGTTNDAPSFTEADASGKLTFIPMPTSGYNMTTTVATTDGAWLPHPGLSWAQLTDSGQFSMYKGFHAGNTWRFADRVYIGEAAYKFAGVFPENGTSWLSALDINYPAINAQLLVTPHERRYAICGATKTDLPTGAGEAIAIAAIAINDAASTFAWGHIVEIEQHETSGGIVGMEIGAKNASSGNPSITPYNVPTGGECGGIQLAGGGDSALSPSATNPSTYGVMFTKNGHTWNVGMVFRADALTGTDGTSGSTGTGAAVQMARRQALQWYEPTNKTVAAQIVSSITTSGKDKIVEFSDSGVGIIADNGGSAFLVVVNDTVANRVQIISAATGNQVEVIAEGETNVTIQIKSKGTGNLTLDPQSGDVRINKALVALGGGAAATLGSIGGTGPATAAQNTWLRLLDNNGNAMWVPVWK